MVKSCRNCKHLFYVFTNNDKIACCYVDGLRISKYRTCKKYIYDCPNNKYTLCSSSECITCDYFDNILKHCNLGK